MVGAIARGFDLDDVLVLVGIDHAETSATDDGSNESRLQAERIFMATADLKVRGLLLSSSHSILLLILL
jgi:hypothetical protein